MTITDDRLRLVPITLRQARAFISAHHRHNVAPVGWKFGVGVQLNGELVAVGTAGRPVARMLDDGHTLEVTRCCTVGTKNAASMIYGALRRAAKALGFTKIITYTREDEEGTTLKASGWTVVCAKCGGGSWNVPSRPREDKSENVFRVRWESVLCPLTMDLR